MVPSGTDRQADMEVTQAFGRKRGVAERWFWKKVPATFAGQKRGHLREKIGREPKNPTLFMVPAKILGLNANGGIGVAKSKPQSTVEVRVTTTAVPPNRGNQEQQEREREKAPIVGLTD